jgi:acyl-CoA synthetase (AMP-forming)/AMP-acid ligase II
MEADGFFSPGSTFAPRMVLLTMYEIVTNTAAISKNQERTALVCKGNGPRPAKTITRKKKCQFGIVLINISATAF